MRGAASSPCPARQSRIFPTLTTEDGELRSSGVSSGRVALSEAKGRVGTWSVERDIGALLRPEAHPTLTLPCPRGGMTANLERPS